MVFALILTDISSMWHQSEVECLSKEGWGDWTEENWKENMKGLRNRRIMKDVKDY